MKKIIIKLQNGNSQTSYLDSTLRNLKPLLKLIMKNQDVQEIIISEQLQNGKWSDIHEITKGE